MSQFLTDYSCALQRDILVHGRLYVSQNWLCFYANIFGWETFVSITLFPLFRCDLRRINDCMENFKETNLFKLPVLFWNRPYLFTGWALENISKFNNLHLLIF